MIISNVFGQNKRNFASFGICMPRRFWTRNVFFKKYFFSAPLNLSNVCIFSKNDDFLEFSILYIPLAIRYKIISRNSKHGSEQAWPADSETTWNFWILDNSNGDTQVWISWNRLIFPCIYHYISIANPIICIAKFQITFIQKGLGRFFSFIYHWNQDNL